MRKITVQNDYPRYQFSLKEEASIFDRFYQLLVATGKTSHERRNLYLMKKYFIFGESFPAEDIFEDFLKLLELRQIEEPYLNIHMVNGQLRGSWYQIHAGLSPAKRTEMKQKLWTKRATLNRRYMDQHQIDEARIDELIGFRPAETRGDLNRRIEEKVTESDTIIQLQSYVLKLAQELDELRAERRQPASKPNTVVRFTPKIVS